MNNTNKQAAIQVVDRYAEIEEHYRPMRYIELLEHMQRVKGDNNGFDDLTEKILDSGKTIGIFELPKLATNPSITDKIDNNLPIYISKKLDFIQLTKCEVIEYAAGVAKCLGDHIKIKSNYEPSKEEAFAHLINLASITGANAIVLDQKASFHNEKGYIAAGKFYVKR